MVHIMAVNASTPKANLIAMSAAVSQPPLTLYRSGPKVTSRGTRS